MGQEEGKGTPRFQAPRGTADVLPEDDFFGEIKATNYQAIAIAVACIVLALLLALLIAFQNE